MMVGDWRGFESLEGILGLLAARLLSLQYTSRDDNWQSVKPPLQAVLCTGLDEQSINFQVGDQTRNLGISTVRAAARVIARSFKKVRKTARLVIIRHKLPSKPST